MAKHDYDLIILGGGLVGCYAALLGQARGLSVLVLKKNIQGIVLGEAFATEADLVFRHLARKYHLNDVLQTTSFESLQSTALQVESFPKRAFHYYHPESEKHIYHQISRYPSLADLHVRRDQFDTALAMMAQKRGITFQDCESINDLETKNDSVLLRYNNRGRVSEVKGRLLIDCSGRAALVSRLKGWFNYDTVFQTSCLYGHLDQAYSKDPKVIALKATSHFFYDKSWSWRIPLGQKKTSFGFVKLGKHSKKSLLAAISQLPAIPKVDTTSLFYAPRVVFNSKKLVAHRVLVMPGAAFFTDPFLSTGIHHSALALLYLENNLEKLLGSDQASQAALHYYEKKFLQENETLQYFLHNFYFCFNKPDVFQSYYSLARLLIPMSGISLIRQLERNEEPSLYYFHHEAVSLVIEKIHELLKNNERADDRVIGDQVDRIIKDKLPFLGTKTRFAKKSRDGCYYNTPFLLVPWLFKVMSLYGFFATLKSIARRYGKELLARTRNFRL